MQSCGHGECKVTSFVDMGIGDFQTIHLNAMHKNLIYGTKISITPVLQCSISPLYGVNVR